MIVKASYVLALILAAQAKTPRLPAFDVVAENVAKESNARPLFKGELGAHETAATLVGLFRFESGNDPSAVGDCAPKDTTTHGTCVPGAKGSSFGLGQVNKTNFAWLGIGSAEAYLSDVGQQVRTVLTMLHRSFTICRARPVDERASWYVRGGDGCPETEEAKRLSRHRLTFGRSLFEKHHSLVGE